MRTHRNRVSGVRADEWARSEIRFGSKVLPMVYPAHVEHIVGGSHTAGHDLLACHPPDLLSSSSHRWSMIQRALPYTNFPFYAIFAPYRLLLSSRRMKQEGRLTSVVTSIRLALPYAADVTDCLTCQ